jgi:hypothetical protein
MSERIGYVEYHDDRIEIHGNADGYPRMTGVIPAPDINTPSEEEREKQFKRVCDDLYLQGYFIVSKRRVRNTTFDRQGQKTTLKIVYRPCKTENEIMQVKDEIQRVVNERVGL